jgi:hypothetical protein
VSTQLRRSKLLVGFCARDRLYIANLPQISEKDAEARGLVSSRFGDDFKMISLCRTVTETGAIGGEAEAGAEGPRLRPWISMLSSMMSCLMYSRRNCWLNVPCSQWKAHWNRTSAIVISAYDRFD